MRTSGIVAASVVLLLFSAPIRADLKRALAEPNLERRSGLALDNALDALKRARAAYDRGETEDLTTLTAEILASADLASASLAQSGKNPRRSDWYKKAEIKTRDLARRLEDFQQQMSYADRALLDKVKARVQQIHEELLIGVMEGKKK